MKRALIRRLPGLSPLRAVHHLHNRNVVGNCMRLSTLPFSTALFESHNAHEVSDLIHEYASKPQTSISLQDMMMLNHTNNVTDAADTITTPNNRQKRAAQEAMLMKMAHMLQAELPVRLAQRIQDLDSFQLLQEMPSVQQVRSIYQTSFLDLVHQPKPTTPQAEQDFGVLLNQLYQNHSNVLRQMARGILELKYQHPDVLNDSQFAASDEAFLDRFYMSRVGIRVLAGQYLALRHQLLNDPMGNIPAEYVGMISKQTSPSRIVQRAVEDATLLCQEQYPGQTPPKVHVSGKMQLTFCYIPTHLHYILLELIKNSMRATMEHHAHLKDKPPILVTIADGTNNEDVIIKVSDQGGGIPRSEMDQIWSYLFTTAAPQVQEEFFQATQQVGCTENGAILAGLGYGLPLSRAYARYFGGELDLASMEGYGTDAFCHLVRLADRAQLLDDSSSNSTSSVVAPDASATNPVATRTMKC